MEPAARDKLLNINRFRRFPFFRRKLWSIVQNIFKKATKKVFTYFIKCFGKFSSSVVYNNMVPETILTNRQKVSVDYGEQAVNLESHHKTRLDLWHPSVRNRQQLQLGIQRFENKVLRTITNASWDLQISSVKEEMKQRSVLYQQVESPSQRIR